MSEPKRIQRKRTKGWRMPPNTISVTRPGRYGNPYSLADYDMEDSLKFCREYFEGQLKDDPTFFDSAKDKDVACFCKQGHRCHGDIVLELANRDQLVIPKFIPEGPVEVQTPPPDSYNQ